MASSQQPAVGSAISTGRLLSLTDGVFAIVMTLLVLGLSVPILTGSSLPQDFAQLLEMWPEFACYFVTFLILGFIWSVHHYLFGLVSRSDSLLVWLNIVFLMFVTLTPFSTSLLAHHMGRALPTLLYEANFLLCQLTGYLTFSYVTGKRRLALSEIAASEIKARRTSWIVGIILVSVAVAMSWFSPVVSMSLFVVFLFSDIAFMIVRFRARATKQ